MGSSASSRAVKRSCEDVRTSSPLQAKPEPIRNKGNAPVFIQRKESHKQPKKDNVPTQGYSPKDQPVSKGDAYTFTNNATATTAGPPCSTSIPATPSAYTAEASPHNTAMKECAGDKDNDTIKRPALKTSTFALDYTSVYTSESISANQAMTEGQKKDHQSLSARDTGNDSIVIADTPGSASIPATSIPATPTAESSSRNTATREERKNDQKRRIIKTLKNRKKSARETEAMVVETMKKAVEKRGVVREMSDTVQNALMGDIDMKCPPPTKVVRIFTSSTFTDTKNERNMLMKHAYPKVKEYCRRIGYEFQVVDMRWGVRDEATDDHMGTELCLKELKLCQEVSTGPNFVSFLSHKYGYTAFPRVIEAEEFETIMAEVEDVESKQLFQRWYTLDNNAVPPAYILSSISSRLPNFISSDGEKKKQAKQIWWDESEKMQNTLDMTATKIFDKERARKYVMSVTETEVTEGLLKSENPSKHSLWFKRDIEDIEEQESCYLLSRYMECTGPNENRKKSRNMLRELKEEKMAKKLSQDRIITYKIKWNKTSGINPDEDVHHKEYLDKLCKDFVVKMKDIIDEGVADRERTDDKLVDECCQHIRFCQSKCEGFQGRQDTLELIKAYVQGRSSEPLVLHGTSGTGKTSIMAMAAKMMKQWTTHPPVLVFRFLGTTPDSSSIMSLLESLASQVRRIYKMPPLPSTATNFDARCKDFEEAMKMGQTDKPLILMLDSLDQLDPVYDARKLGWLVTQLAPGTKMIVSTLPEPIYDCFPALRTLLKSESSFVSVPVLDNSDVKTILENWLKMRQRRLPDHQMTTVLNAFKECPTPLFLKLSFEEAATWSSFMPADKTVLQDTVRASIDFLFQKLEKTHGKLLVSRALGHLTIANNGATEAELEDILSCDDDVLNDVYMYWTPPIRRLPPLLLVRIRTDLNQYLVERGADGVRVIYWYHRQFIEAAEARYCSDKDTNRLIHERLADFFNGTWANGKKKQYTNSKGESGEEDRHVALQPLKFGPKHFNMRTLNNLPYHRTNAGQVELLKDQCLANPTFLIHKLEAVPLYSVVKDYAMAKQAFPDDDLIKEVLQALNLSQKALTTDPRQLIPQLLQRLEESNVTKQLLDRCREYPSTYILPTKCVLERPGGQLVHSISAHKNDIDMMDMSSDGKLVVTACLYDNAVKVWEVDGGKKKTEIKGLGQDTDMAMFCNYNKWLACDLGKKIAIVDVDTGVTLKSLSVSDRQTSFCLLGKGRTFIMQFMKQAYKLTDLLADPNEEQISSGLHPDNLEFGSDPIGSDNYLAVFSHTEYFITVYDLNLRTFRPSFRAFPKIPDKNNPGEFNEYKAKGLKISPDETCLVYMATWSSEVVFADLDGNKLRSIPADVKRYYKDNGHTIDGRHLYLFDDNMIYFFDTQSLQEVGKLEQQNRINMAITHDAVNVVTISDDGNLRIYDRSRKELTNGKPAKCPTKMYSFDFVHVLNNPRYVLLCGSDEDYGTMLCLEVHDVFTNTMVRWGELANSEGGIMICSEAFNTKNDDQVVLFLGCPRDGKQIVRVDLQTMKVVKSYVGFTTEATMAEDTEEIFCTTRHGMHMKLYNKNGDFVTVMKAGQKQKIFSIQVNTTGTVGCAKTEQGPFMFYDIKNRTHLYNLQQGTYNYGYSTLINKAGTRLVFSTDSKIAGVPIMDDIDHMVLWNIQDRKEICRLYDAESQELLEVTNSEDDVAVDGMCELDDTRLLSTHEDYVIRVWNIQTGQLLTQLGHTGPLRVTLCEKSQYILSYSSLEDENYFDYLRLWDKTSYECVASFNLDKPVNELFWSADGKFLISGETFSPPDFTMWKIYHGHDHMTVNKNDYPQLFSRKEEAAEEPMKIKIYKPEALEMKDDPDSDREEIDKDSDDGDDDDDEDDDDEDD